LKQKAGVLTKSWAKTQTKIIQMLNALSSNQVYNRKSILELWKVNPKFLLKEYILWLPEELHATITKHWPPFIFKAGSVFNNEDLIKDVQKLVCCKNPSPE
jgi:hypothetical protein